MEPQFIQQIFTTLLPVSTPLNLVLIAAIIWLARDRAKILDSLDLAHQELISEKEKRSECLEKVYQEFMERGEAAYRLMAEFKQVASAVLERIGK